MKYYYVYINSKQYELNGYKYEIDSLGRQESAKGTLHLRQREDRLAQKDSMDKVGRGDQRPTDDIGHIIGDQFDGPSGIENSTAQDSKENRGIYRNLEKQLADKIKEGADVKVKIELVYNNNSFRPSARVFHYSINGEKHVQIFPNGG